MANQSLSKTESGGTGLSRTWLALMIGNALLFVTFALLPFSLHSRVAEFGAYSNVATDCPKNHACIQHDFIGWLSPSDVKVAGIVGIIVLALTGAAILWFSRRVTGYRSMKRAGLLQLLVAVMVIILTACTYTAIRRDSQASDIGLYDVQVQAAHDLSEQLAQKDCKALPKLFDGQQPPAYPTQENECVVLFEQAAKPVRQYGYGLAPAYLVAGSFVYILPSLLGLNRLVLSRKYIGGLKKETLFQ